MIQEYLQPKIGRKIRIFSLRQKLRKKNKTKQNKTRLTTTTTTISNIEQDCKGRGKHKGQSIFSAYNS